MIKTHYFLSGRIDWMTYRSQNIAQIVEVMVDNLEGLRAVRSPSRLRGPIGS